MFQSLLQKVLLVLLATLLSGMLPAFAAGDPLEELGFINTPAETLVSTSRFPRPISKVAENVTIITAADISRINAHTLADVLQTVPGIELDQMRTPSSQTFFSVQGALSTTVLVLVDGIRQNDFDQNMAASGVIPVQQIERIEIIKGAASAAWGSALGGVINIITKSPNPEKNISGLISGSTGSQFTADSRAELSGTFNRLGYYLTAGNLRSDGLTLNGATNRNNLYSKFVYNLPSNGTATLGFSHLTASPGLDGSGNWFNYFVWDTNQYRRTNGFLVYSQPLANRLSVDIDGYFTDRDDHTKYYAKDITTFGVYRNDYTVREKSRVVKGRITWGDNEKNLVAGMEYGHGQGSFRDLQSSDPPVYDRRWDHWAFYANGAYSLGKFTLLPGVRYDLTGLYGDKFSYTVGSTYQLTEKTTLRAYGAEGFSLPTLRNPGDLQKISTVQAGIETEAIPYLWLKGTYYHNDLRNSQSAGNVLVSNQERQGFEIEARTAPLYGVSLTSGYTYLAVKNADTGRQEKTNNSQTVPPHLVKLAINYDKVDLGLRATLTGNYVWWNNVPDYASKSGMIWDLHLNWLLKTQFNLSPELFFSGHNLFNGVQTTYEPLYKNAPRWFEGGVRVRF